MMIVITVYIKIEKGSKVPNLINSKQL